VNLKVHSEIEKISIDNEIKKLMKVHKEAKNESEREIKKLRRTMSEF
jgi:hypothetical protein